MTDYYGPCDVRSEQGVMRLQCELHLGGVRGYLSDLYRAELYDIERREVALILPNGVELAVRTGDTRLRSGEPVGWAFDVVSA